MTNQLPQPYKYLQPYFMSAEGYFTFRHRKVEPVYIHNLDSDDDSCSLIIYNDDKTQIKDECAWYDINELISADDAHVDALQQNLDGLWSKYEEEERKHYDRLKRLSYRTKR